MGGVLLVAALSVMFCVSLVALSRVLVRRQSVRRAVGCAALCCYILANLYVTVLSRKPSETIEPILDFLSSYVHILVQKDGNIAFSAYWFTQVALNWLMFVPLGCLLPFTWPEALGCVLGYLMYRLLARFVEAHVDDCRGPFHDSSYTPRHLAR